MAHGTKVATADIYVSNPSTAKLEALKSEHPEINTTTNNCDAAAVADIIILAVKPWKVEQVLEEIKPHIDYSHQAVASMVGGLGIGQLSASLQHTS